MVSSERVTIGVFVIGGVLLFAAGLFMIGNRRLLFSDSVELATQFSGLSGLQKGAKVRVSGMDAGEILEIRVPPGPASKFVVKFRLLESLHNIVRQDSVATIQTDGLLGNKFLQVDAGTEQAPMAPPDSTIPSREPFEISDLMLQVRDTVKNVSETFASVRGDLTDAAKTVAETTDHVDDLIVGISDDVARITSTVNFITENLKGIIGDVQAGQGTVGRLFKEDVVYKNIETTVDGLKDTVSNLQAASADVKKMVADVQAGNVVKTAEQTLTNVRDATERLKEALSAMQSKEPGGESVAKDLRATIGSAREAMADLADDMEALKRGFFFRGYFNNRGFYDLDNLSVAEYQSDHFADKRKRTSEWIPKDQLFVNQDGVEMISEGGKRRLDAAFSKFLSFVKSRPIVVEGYCATGTADERFLCSRERALRVRDYLIAKFQFDGNYLGAIPMGANEPHKDGVALTLIRQ